MCERAPPPPPAAFRWQQWLHQLPLRVGQVRVIAASASMITHPPNMITPRQDSREDTPSPINFPDTFLVTLVGWAALERIAAAHEAEQRRAGGGYDRVLVDASRTGLGALRPPPEARWRRQPSDVPELVGL